MISGRRRPRCKQPRLPGEAAPGYEAIMIIGVMLGSDLFIIMIAIMNANMIMNAMLMHLLGSDYDHRDL